MCSFYKDAIIPEDINIEDKYIINILFRRGETNRDKVMSVPQRYNEFENWWNNIESKSVSLPKFTMAYIYVEINQATESIIFLYRYL